MTEAELRHALTTLRRVLTTRTPLSRTPEQANRWGATLADAILKRLDGDAIEDGGNVPSFARPNIGADRDV